jgi:hypothetical protein
LGFFKEYFCGEYMEEIDQLEAKLKTQTALKEAYIKVNDALKISLESWKRQADYYKTQYELLEAKEQGIETPDITEYIQNPIRVKPYEVWSKPDNGFILAGDPQYLIYNRIDWTSIFEKVQPIIEDRWRKDIWDCDNYAEFFHAYLAYIMKENGAELQGCIAITWSRTHAYNCFMDHDKNIWVYEPQNGEIKGQWQDPLLDEMYKTRIVLLTH